MRKYKDGQFFLRVYVDGQDAGRPAMFSGPYGLAESDRARRFWEHFGYTVSIVLEREVPITARAGSLWAWKVKV